MSIRRAGVRALRDERGSVLLGSLVLVAILTLLGGALFDLATLEGGLAFWDSLSTQSMYCAEGGASRAIVDILPPGAANNPLAWSGASQTLVSAFGTCSYVVTYANTASPRTLTSTGTVRGESRTVRLTGQTFQIKDALMTGGPLTISGNAPVAGACGNVHANGDLTVSGNPTIAGDLTSSGTYSAPGNEVVGGQAAGGRPPHAAPAIRPTDFLTTAKQTLPANQIFQLIPTPPLFLTATVLDGNNLPIAALVSGDIYRGWKFNGGALPEWDHTGNVGFDGTYYLQGFVKIGDNPGTPGTPWRGTILVDPVVGPALPNKAGSIEISGNAALQAHLDDTLIVAGRDVKLNGNPSQDFTEGVIAAHEQIYISGNPPISGAVYAEDGGADSDLVTLTSVVSGDPSITYQCGLTLNIDCWPQAGCRRFEEVKN